MGLELGQAVSYNEGQIQRVEIDLVGNRIYVQVAYGYRDGSGNFVRVTGAGYEIEGSDFDELSRQLTNGGSFYDEIKNAIWNKLIAMGKVSGTVV